MVKIVVDYERIAQRLQKYVVEFRDNISQKSLVPYLKGCLGSTHSRALFNVLQQTGVFITTGVNQRNRFTKTLDYFSSDRVQSIFIDNNILKCNNPRRSGPKKGSRTDSIIKRLDVLERSLTKASSEDPLSEIIRLSIQLKDAGLTIVIKEGKVIIS